MARFFRFMNILKMSMDMKCKCGSVIPEVRVNMGYSECVGCSSVERVGVVDVVYHKTGNTIEITTGEVADSVRKLSRRRGFGTMTCMGGKKSEVYNPRGMKNKLSVVQVGSEVGFERVGAKCMEVYDSSGIEAAERVLERGVRDMDISQGQAGKIRRIFQALEAGNSEDKSGSFIGYRDGKEVEKGISDIDWVFRSWRV